MNKSYSEKMQEHFYWFTGMSCLYAVLFTICVHDNTAGIMFPFITLITLYFSVLYLKKVDIKIKKNTFLYFGSIVILSVSTCMTSNSFFHFFNFMGIILLFCMAMLSQLDKNYNSNFIYYVKKMILLLVSCFLSIIKPFQYTIPFLTKEKLDGKRKIIAVFVGIILSGLFLILVLPLLIFSDQIFSSYFQDIFRYFNLWNFLDILFTFLVGYVLFYAFFIGLFEQKIKETELKQNKKISALTGITFTGILTFFYVIYSGIQIIFLFLRFDSGIPEEITYSEYARSGFWQLLAVSIINIITVLLCTQIFDKNKILKILLLLISVCTCIMSVSAIYRMMLYVNVYHLTFLRALVLWFLGVLLLIMIGIQLFILRSKFHLFQYIVVIVTSCYILFSFVCIDKMIASYNINHFNDNNFDFYYMMNGLSEDAVPIIADFAIKEYDKCDENLKCVMEQYFQTVAEERMSFREWNYSEYQAKKAAKKYMEYISTK